MATSGTVAQTRITIQKLVDKAFLRAGKNPSTVSGELLESALSSLYIFCSELVNEGVNLFCIRKLVLNIRPTTPAYTLAPGADDILNVLYRSLYDLPGTPTLDISSRGVNLVTPTAIQVVSGSFNVDGMSQPVIEYNNGTGWINVLSLGTLIVVNGTDFAADILRPVISANWRVRDISGNNIVPSVVAFRTVKDEVNLAQLNRDDYVNLPNKQRIWPANSRALQYWYDKQLTPTLFVWPVSNIPADQLVIYQHGQIEDLGRMTNTLAVPDRWLEAVIFGLSSRLCLEIPPEELPPGRYELIKGQAAEYLAKAGRGESDGSSFRLQPRIRGYTR